MQSNQQRIKKLINSKQLQLPHPSEKPMIYNFKEEKEEGEGLVIGSVCGCIVVDKDQTKQQLIMHLICIYGNGKSRNISEQRIKGYIKSYDLKVDLSIFTYINSFQQIFPGAFINAVIRRFEKRNQEILYQMCLTRPKQLKSVKLGVIKDDLEIPSSIMKVYEKQKTLPMNYQILYQKDFDNPGLTETLINNMNVKQYGSLHSISNVKAISSLNLQPQRIRHDQQTRWGQEYFQQSVKEIQRGNNETAIQFLNIAKDFDHENVEIYIAKSCALINMKNYSQGFKQIKEALRINPKSQQAQKIHEQIHTEMTKREKDKLPSSAFVFKKTLESSAKRS